MQIIPFTQDRLIGQGQRPAVEVERSLIGKLLRGPFSRQDGVGALLARLLGGVPMIDEIGIVGRQIGGVQRFDRLGRGLQLHFVRSVAQQTVAKEIAQFVQCTPDGFAGSGLELLR